MKAAYAAVYPYWENTYAEYSDAAIVVLRAGSGSEITHSMQFDAVQMAMVDYAAEHFETVIVLINSTNALDCSFLYDYDVDAALWIGYTGEWGLNAVADILVGKVSPSGKLVDTYTFDNTTAYRRSPLPPLTKSCFPATLFA